MSARSFPTLAIVGRPNVGKSTLFNRLLGRKRALVHNLPGVTRDRLEEIAEWYFNKTAYPVKLLDTGGVGEGTFSHEIEAQVQLALRSADAVVFVVDGTTGVTREDHEFLTKLRRSGVLSSVPSFLLVNKIDHDHHEDRLTDFYSLGFENVLGISAEHNRGVETLKDEVLQLFQSKGLLQTLEQDENAGVPKIAIVGKPNVGKSTLVNAMLGEERMIVSPIAGTTVDSIDSMVTVGDRQLMLIDTAGIRRKSKTEQGVEVLSVIQTQKALERADLALLVIDGELGPTEQDEKIGSLIEEVGCSVIIGVNKWDLIDSRRERDKKGKLIQFTPDMAAEHIRSKMGYLRWAPIVLMSAKAQKGYEDLPDLIDDILEKRSRRVSTNELTEWVQKIILANNPFGAKFFNVSQVSTNPPTFLCRVNDPGKIHFSLTRHLINQIRETYGFDGSPVRIKYKT